MKIKMLGVAVLAAMGTACTPQPIDPTDIAEVTRANNDFGLSLLQQEHGDKPTENIFVSPLSVFSALAMTTNGADGQTLVDMENTLAFDGVSLTDMNAEYQTLIADLDKIDPKVDISLANSIWYRDGFDVKQDFVDAVQSNYEAEIQALDFSSPNAKDQINNWVDDKTNGYIDKIVEQITPSHVMFLVNALFFKGKWDEGFDSDNTQDRPFTLDDNTLVQAEQMMATESNRLVFRNQEVSLVEMPYKKEGFSLVLVKPENGTVDQLLSSLTMDDLNSWIGNVSESEVTIQVPKMKIEYESELNQSLIDLGMEVAFTAGAADFTGIADAELSISEVKHKTYLEIDESGTTAAAVTSVGVVETSLPIVEEYRFDSPFLIFLRERDSGLVLFSGKIMDPR